MLRPYKGASTAVPRGVGPRLLRAGEVTPAHSEKGTSSPPRTGLRSAAVRKKAVSARLWLVLAVARGFLAAAPPYAGRKRLTPPGFTGINSGVSYSGTQNGCCLIARLASPPTPAALFNPASHRRSPFSH